MDELLGLLQNQQFQLAALLTAAVAYLLGSINFAIIVSYAYAHEDIRIHGSGNAGMTNILRTYGKGPAFCTGLGDFGKGMAAVLLGRLIFGWFGIGVDGGYVATIAVMLGHLFPLYFHFKGGKGILTSTGAILILNPVAFFILFVCFVPIAFLTRIVSLASVLGTAAYPIIVYIQCRLAGRPVVYETCFAVFAALLVLYMHRANIKRLLNGTENKIGSVPKGHPHPDETEEEK